MILEKIFKKKTTLAKNNSYTLIKENRPSFVNSNTMSGYFEDIKGLNKPQRYFYNFIYNRK